MTGAAMTIGMANIVTSARNRRSRTSRRLVDSPRTLWEARSSWIAMAPWARAVVGRTVYSPETNPTDGHRGTPVRRTNGSVAGRRPRAHDGSVFILYAVLTGLVIGLLSGG